MHVPRVLTLQCTKLWSQVQEKGYANMSDGTHLQSFNKLHTLSLVQNTWERTQHPFINTAGIREHTHASLVQLHQLQRKTWALL